MSHDRALRLYRLLLRIAPARLNRHAAEMTALFAERLDDAAHAGRLAVVAVWAAAIVDVLRAAALGRWRTSPRVPGPVIERTPVMLGSDLRYTFRWLARQKASTALVVAMLSIGMAANVVVFSLVSALFIKPLPFPDDERLVYINETAPRWNLEVVGVNFPDFHEWQRDAQMFDALALYDPDSFNLSDDRGAERIEGAVVTEGFARALGVSPLLGRMFTADEDRPKAPAVVVIGEALWRERFGASSDVLGKTLKLDGISRTIVGVMPRAAEFPGRVKLWVPLAGDPEQPYQNYSYAGLGRMKPGVTVAAAEKDLARVHEAIWTRRDTERIVSPFARPLREEFVRDYRATARTLLVAVVLLLFIACANVASVMLARALARRREIGIRLAVGASVRRLTRQLSIENLVLAAISGIIGLALGRWALAVLLAAAGDQVPSWTSYDLDGRVIGFGLLLVVGTALLFGIAPVVHAVRGNVRGAMQEGSAATTAGPGGRRTLRTLVGAEFAIAAVLLASGGLLWRAYERVRSVDPGFRTDHVLTFQIALPEARYPDDPKRLAFWERLVAELQAAPGVHAAGLVNCPPLGCHNGTFFAIEGRPPLKPGEVNPVTLFRQATPDYFKAMGVRLKAGRVFTQADGRDMQNPSAIVNEAFVRTFWPNVDTAVGRRFKGNGSGEPWITVIGVTEDVKHYGLERPMRPGVYFPVAAIPRATLTAVVQTAGDPSAFVASARRIVQGLDPELPLFRIRTMEQALQRSMATRALYSWLLAVFASIAFVLALGGSYGVTSYLVSQRARELGIRLALGARSRDIARTVLAGSLAIVVLGVSTGVAGALALGRLLSSLLFGVAPRDPAVLASVVAVLVGVALLANWIPARRAARTDPLSALRTQ